MNLHLDKLVVDESGVTELLADDVALKFLSRDATIKPRPYQTACVEAVLAACKAGERALGVIPTAGGKSLIAAMLAHVCHYEHQRRGLIIVPSLELVPQNLAAIRSISPHAYVTAACAGFDTPNLAGFIVVGTFQTIVNRIGQDPGFDFLLVDEGHRLGVDESSQLNKILAANAEKRPGAWLCGLTASPFRLDSGRLTEGEHAPFSKIAYEAHHRDLLKAGYLSPLVAPADLEHRLDTTGLHIVAGDYSQADLRRYENDNINAPIAAAICKHGRERKSWLVFCVSIRHAEVMVALLQAAGVDAVTLTSETKADIRREVVHRFKGGALRCLVGVNVFAVGFDVPAVDLIAIVRPTASPVWHVQSSGRGTRIAPDKKICLILDFAGNFARLGPFDDPHVRAKGERADANGSERDRYRRCEHCASINGLKERHCVACGTILVKEREISVATAPDHAARVISTGPRREEGVYDVLHVYYLRHSKADRPDSLRIEYYLRGRRFSISEWLTLDHGGYAGAMARDKWRSRAIPGSSEPDDVSDALAMAKDVLRKPPRVRITRVDGFDEVTPLFD